jgi:hypothetical protein
MSNKRLSRNEPCPCGSGKKYKYCCYQQDRDTPLSRFPIGTIAIYGPNDEITTKIVASVIIADDAEPILERWVSTDVLENPKVQREIKEFFARHSVKSVATSEGNMGCPHEEGEDFPEGDDCPFCPYWEGKQ